MEQMLNENDIMRMADAVTVIEAGHYELRRIYSDGCQATLVALGHLGFGS